MAFTLYIWEADQFLSTPSIQISITAYREPSLIPPCRLRVLSSFPVAFADLVLSCECSAAWGTLCHLGLRWAWQDLRDQRGPEGTMRCLSEAKGVQECWGEGVEPQADLEPQQAEPTGVTKSAEGGVGGGSGLHVRTQWRWAGGRVLRALPAGRSGGGGGEGPGRKTKAWCLICSWAGRGAGGPSQLPPQFPWTQIIPRAPASCPSPAAALTAPLLLSRDLPLRWLRAHRYLLPQSGRACQQGRGAAAVGSREQQSEGGTKRGSSTPAPQDQMLTLA